MPYSKFNGTNVQMHRALWLHGMPMLYQKSFGLVCLHGLFSPDLQRLTHAQPIELSVRGQLNPYEQPFCMTVHPHFYKWGFECFRMGAWAICLWQRASSLANFYFFVWHPLSDFPPSILCYCTKHCSFLLWPWVPQILGPPCPCKNGGFGAVSYLDSCSFLRRITCPWALLNSTWCWVPFGIHLAPPPTPQGFLPHKVNWGPLWQFLT